jgi:hypothetical protein
MITINFITNQTKNDLNLIFSNFLNLYGLLLLFLLVVVITKFICAVNLRFHVANARAQISKSLCGFLKAIFVLLLLGLERDFIFN